MNSVFQALKLDFFTVKTAYYRIIIIYFVSIFIGLSTQPMMPIILIMFFSVSFSGLTFSIIEKNKYEKLYGILPIHRREIIAGRYLYGFITGIVNLLVSIILVHILAAVSNQKIDILTIFFSITFSFCYYCFAVSMSYPIYYRFGFSRSYIFITLPLYLLIVLAALLSERTNLIKNIERFLLYFTNHYILFFLYGFILSIFMLIISAMISYGIFKNSEI